MFSGSTHAQLLRGVNIDILEFMTRENIVLNDNVQFEIIVQNRMFRKVDILTDKALPTYKYNGATTWLAMYR